MSKTSWKVVTPCERKRKNLLEFVRLEKRAISQFYIHRFPDLMNYILSENFAILRTKRKNEKIFLLNREFVKFSIR